MKPNQYKATHVSLRIGLFVIALLAGFLFPLSFALAALLGAQLFADVFGLPGKNGQQETLKSLTESDANWIDAVCAVCDSPAEEAFVRAMITDFGLKPKDGLLVGPDLTLALQVPVARYRLDFLVDDRLIVEIDGAAYHSSPEAVARDAARDAYFTEEGYQILRIPAKYPLYVPQEATDRVATALARLRSDNHAKAAELRDSVRPTRVFAALSDGLHRFGEGLSDATAEITRKIEEQKEQDRLRVERETEETLRKIQEKLDTDPEYARLYREIEAEFGK